MCSANGKPVVRNDTLTVLPEDVSDPFPEAHIPGDTLQAIIARAIERDGRTTGVCLDADVAMELADHVLDVLADLCDDTLAAIDLASFVFDGDVRRALAA